MTRCVDVVKLTIDWKSEIAFLSPHGEKARLVPYHMFLQKFAYFRARDPPVPRTFVSLISCLYLFVRK